MVGIISWHYLVRFRPVLATPTHCLGVAKLALRVFPAVTRLTAYRWLHIPVKTVWPSAASILMYIVSTFDRFQLLIGLFRCVRAKM